MSGTENKRTSMKKGSETSSAKSKITHIDKDKEDKRLNQMLRQAGNYGLGFITLTKEKAENIADEFVKKNNLDPDKGKALAEELLNTGRAKGKDLEREIKAHKESIRNDLKKEMDGWVSRQDISKNKEIMRMNRKIEKMEKEIINLKKKKG